jgi:dihydrofolate reductase
MDLIVLVDKNWAIGNQDRLLVRIKEDMRRFRDLTMGHTVILGRKTLETFPGAEPLEGRTNWILSRQEDYKPEGARVFLDLDSLLEELKWAEDRGEKVFVIGGSSVYKQLLPYCRYAEITELDKAYESADAYFPDLRQMENWTEVWRSETKEAGKKEPFTYHFVRYENQTCLCP